MVRCVGLFSWSDFVSSHSLLCAQETASSTMTHHGND